PFGGIGLRPPPESSARVFVAWVPWRAAASCALTTWCIKATLASTSKSSAGRSTDTFLTAMSLGSLHCIANQHNAATGTRYCTFNEQQVVLCIDAVQSEVLGGSFDIAHTAGQFFTFENAAWRGGATNRTWFTVVLLLPVRSACATELVAFHGTCETFTFGAGSDIDKWSCFELLNGQVLAKLIVSYIRGTDLDEVTAWCHTGFVKVSDQWFGDLARVDCAVGYLNGTVAVVFFVSQLGHYVRLSLNHSNGNEVVVLVPYLGHAELRAHQSLNFWGCGHSSLSTSLA